MIPGFVAGAASAGVVGLMGYGVSLLRNGHDQYSLAQSKNANAGMADFLLAQTLLSERCILNKDGSLAAVFEVEFADTSGLDKRSHIDRCSWINSSLVEMEGWQMGIDVCPLPAKPLSMPSYSLSTGAETLSAARVGHFGNDRVARKVLVTLTFTPPSSTERNFLRLVVDAPQITEPSLQEMLAKFEATLTRFEALLEGRVASLRRLGLHPLDETRSELVEALFLIIHHEETEIRSFENLSAVLSRDIEGGLYPVMGGKLVRVVPVSSFPTEAIPGVADAFGAIRGKMRFSVRMFVVDAVKGEQRISAVARRWGGSKYSLLTEYFNGRRFAPKVNADASRMELGAEAHRDRVRGGRVRSVYMSPAIVILADSQAEAEEAVVEAGRVFRQVGFTPRPPERFGAAVAGLFGTFPSDAYHGLRNYLTESGVAARVIPSSKPSSGRRSWNCAMCGPRKEPLAVCVTPSGDDYALDLHNGDCMSGLIVGPVGGGKSTFLNAIAGWFVREPGDQVFFADIGRTNKITCSYLGGSYLDPFASERKTRLALFDGIEDDEQRLWVAEFLTTLGAVNDVAATPERKDLAVELVGLMVGKPSDQRRLSSFLSLLRGKDYELHTALAQYAIDGLFDGVFDGVASTEVSSLLTDRQYQAIELGAIMTDDARKKTLAAPVMLFWLRSIFRRLKGHRTLVCMDEGWIYFQNAEVVAMLDRALRLFRSWHAGVLFAMHHFEDVPADAPIRATVFSACRSYFFCPGAETTSIFDKLELTERQRSMISAGVGKRDYFLGAMGEAGKLDAFRLNLSTAERHVYGGTSKAAVERVSRLISEHGESWREFYLNGKAHAREAVAR